MSFYKIVCLKFILCTTKITLYMLKLGKEILIKYYYILSLRRFSPYNEYFMHEKVCIYLNILSPAYI